MTSARPSPHIIFAPDGRLTDGELVGDPVREISNPGSVVGSWLGQARVPAGTCVFLRCCQAVRVPGYGSSVGACATARKPLAALGLGLTAALRVRSAALLAPGAALSDTQPAPTGRRRTR